MTGKSGEVGEELWKRRVDVCGLQETRWKGESARFVGAKGRRYKFWWKGGDGNGGVGVMVKEELAEQVCEVRRKSDSGCFVGGESDGKSYFGVCTTERTK
jgi:exonuclease III